MRYYFDVIGEADLTKDSEGIELANPAQMKAKAMAILAEIASETLPSDDQIQLATRVRDAKGTPVYEANLVIEGKEPSQ